MIASSVLLSVVALVGIYFVATRTTIGDRTHSEATRTRPRRRWTPRRTRPARTRAAVRQIIESDSHEPTGSDADYELLQHQMTAIADLIAAPHSFLPHLRNPVGEVSLHVEISQGRYAYVLSERDKEQSRDATSDLDLLLYWVFRDVTHDVADTERGRRRTKGQDPRLGHITKQLQLISDLSSGWEARYRLDRAWLLDELDLS